MEENNRKARNTLDSSMRPISRQCKKIWMLRPRTSHAYGLNDCLRDENKKDDTHVLLAGKYLSLPRKRNKNSGDIHKNKHSLSPDENSY